MSGWIPIAFVIVVIWLGLKYREKLYSFTTYLASLRTPPGTPAPTPGGTPAPSKMWRYMGATTLMFIALIILVMSGMLRWDALTGTWGTPSIPRMSVLAWDYVLYVAIVAGLIIWAVGLLVPKVVTRFAWGVLVVAGIVYIGGPIGAWIANDFAGQRAHWYGTAPTAPPVLPSHHRVSIDATTGRSAPIKVPPGKTVRTLQLASMELHGVLEDGRDLTAFKNWPIDTPGHYQCFPIRFAYVLDLERRATSVEYWYEDYPCPK